MADSTTFKVANKTPEQFESNRETPSGADKSICSQSISYKQEHCTEVLVESQLPATVHASPINGFVHTVIDCYNHHYNLVIRPDDIWMAILTQFSFYINGNAEEFRSKFVDFDGKKTLSVGIPGSLRSAPYDLFVTQMTEQIDENLVDKTVKDWIMPNFSTTTINDIVSCGVVFMATTQKYFSFECCLLCGIPNITLEGTVADWESISNRLEKLKEYKLDKWYEMLKPILGEFVAAKKNNVNVEFWNRICHHLGGGSGPSYISGWLAAFAVFSEDGVWAKDVNDGFMGVSSAEEEWPIIDFDKIPSGTITVDVKIVDVGGDEYKSLLIAGHVGHNVLEDNCTLTPQIGWGIALKRSAEEVQAFHKTTKGK